MDRFGTLSFFSELQVSERKVDIRENFSEEWGDESEVRRHVDKFGGDHTDLSDVKAFILYLFASRNGFTNQVLLKDLQPRLADLYEPTRVNTWLS